MHVSGNWKALLDNLEFLGQLRKQRKLTRLSLSFVVQTQNYKEMIEFIALGKKYHVDSVVFSLVSDWGTWSIEEYNDHAIWKTNHREFSDFISILQRSELNDPIVNLGNLSEYRNHAIG